MKRDDRFMLTVLAAVVCSCAALASKGDTGTGWFLLALLIIW